MPYYIFRPATSHVLKPKVGYADARIQKQGNHVITCRGRPPVVLSVPVVL